MYFQHCDEIFYATCEVKNQHLHTFFITIILAAFPFHNPAVPHLVMVTDWSTVQSAYKQPAYKKHSFKKGTDFHGPDEFLISEFYCIEICTVFITDNRLKTFSFHIAIWSKNGGTTLLWTSDTKTHLVCINAKHPKQLLW